MSKNYNIAKVFVIMAWYVDIGEVQKGYSLLKNLFEQGVVGYSYPIWTAV